MDKVQKLNYQRDVEKYLESKKIYEMFETMVRSLVINQPRDPIDYMIQKLSEPERKSKFYFFRIIQNIKKGEYSWLDHLVQMLES